MKIDYTPKNKKENVKTVKIPEKVEEGNLTYEALKPDQIKSAINYICSIHTMTQRTIDHKAILTIYGKLAKTIESLQSSQDQELIKILNKKVLSDLFESAGFKAGLQLIKGNPQNSNNGEVKKVINILQFGTKNSIEEKQEFEAKKNEESNQNLRQDRASLLTKLAEKRKLEKKNPIQENIKPLDFEEIVAPERYVSPGKIHKGEKLITTSRQTELLMPNYVPMYLKFQVLGCASDMYGINAPDTKESKTSSAIETGIAEFANEYLSAKSNYNIDGVVQYPAASSADTDTKIDIGSIHAKEQLIDSQKQNLQIYYKLVEKFYFFTQESILTQYDSQLPNKISDIMNFIPQLELGKRADEFKVTLQEYLGLLKTLRDQIKKDTTKALSDPNIPLALFDEEAVSAYFKAKVNLTSYRVLIDKILGVVNKFENILLNEISLESNGLQIKTSAMKVEKYIEENGESLPIAIGATPESIALVKQKVSDPNVSEDDYMKAQRYIDALEAMCDNLLS
jgi:hypothetical protein